MARSNPVAELSLSDIRKQMEANTFQLVQMTSTIKLLAFACEARRVLTELEDLCDIDPALSDRLAQNIVCRYSWTEHDDVTAEVLLQVGDQMKEVCEAGERIAMGLPAAQLGIKP
jgi:hypothetical protein